MDMQMPVIDGYSAARAIRKREHENEISTTSITTLIITLAAHVLKEDKQKKKSLDAGRTAHTTKPIKKITLIEAIHKYIVSPAP